MSGTPHCDDGDERARRLTRISEFFQTHPPHPNTKALPPPLPPSPSPSPSSPSSLTPASLYSRAAARVSAFFTMSDETAETVDHILVRLAWGFTYALLAFFCGLCAMMGALVTWELMR